jgi:type IV pilus assembly protein PilB
MYMTEEMKNIINKDVSSDVLREMAIQNGMTTLFDACKVYVLKGVTSISELMSVATNI